MPPMSAVMRLQFVVTLAVPHSKVSSTVTKTFSVS
jgi:hypothetical protein